MSTSIVRKFAGAAALVLLAAVAYLCFWPVPAEPVSWEAQTPPGYTGAFAPNTRLAGLRTIDVGDEVGPEHIAIGPDGKLYAAMMSGDLLRMSPDGTAREAFATTGGRVLGFDFDAGGQLIAADAMKGLLAISPDAHVSASELLCPGQTRLDLLYRQRRVRRGQGRFSGDWPLSRPLPAHAERAAGSLCRGASDDEYDDEQSRLRRR